MRWQAGINRAMYDPSRSAQSVVAERPLNWAIVERGNGWQYHGHAMGGHNTAATRVRWGGCATWAAMEKPNTTFLSWRCGHSLSPIGWSMNCNGHASFYVLWRHGKDFARLPMAKAKAMTATALILCQGLLFGQRTYGKRYRKEHNVCAFPRWVSSWDKGSNGCCRESVI